MSHAKTYFAAESICILLISHKIADPSPQTRPTNHFKLCLKALCHARQHINLMPKFMNLVTKYFVVSATNTLQKKVTLHQAEKVNHFEPFWASADKAFGCSAGAKGFCSTLSFQPKQRSRDSNQSVVWSALLIVGTGLGDIRTLTWSPFRSSCLCR